MVDMETVEALAGKICLCDPSKIYERSRKQEIVRARKIIACYLHYDRKIPVKTISRKFGLDPSAIHNYLIGGELDIKYQELKRRIEESRGENLWPDLYSALANALAGCGGVSKEDLTLATDNVLRVISHNKANKSLQNKE